MAERFDQIEPSRIRELCRLLHDGATHSAQLLESIRQWAWARIFLWTTLAAWLVVFAWMAAAIMHGRRD